MKVFEDNIDADPLFVDPENHDFRLSEDSPCRDAGWLGTPQEVLEGLDLGGSARLVNQRIDIGPYEYSPAGVDEPLPQLPFARLIGNPLRPESRLVLELNQAEAVKVKVYSLTGGEIAAYAFPCTKGVNEMRLGTLTDRLAPGVYLLEIVAGSRKCILKAVR